MDDANPDNRGPVELMRDIRSTMQADSAAKVDPLVTHGKVSGDVRKLSNMVGIYPSKDPVMQELVDTVHTIIDFIGWVVGRVQSMSVGSADAGLPAPTNTDAVVDHAPASD